MPDPGFGPEYPPYRGDFALDDVISDHTTLGAVAYSSGPAQHGLVLAPGGIVFIVVLTVFEAGMMQVYGTTHRL